MEEDLLTDDILETLDDMEKSEIKDARYYLVRPEDSSWVYLMMDKPDYIKSPFYKDIDDWDSTESFLEENCINYYDTQDLNSDTWDFLESLDLIPEENSFIYYPPAANSSTPTLEGLLDKDLMKSKEEIIKLCKKYSGLIALLLNEEPFRSWIQDKIESDRNLTTAIDVINSNYKDSKHLNKRLLI